MLKTILPAEGLPCAWILTNRTREDGKLISYNKVFDSVDALESALPELDKGEDQVYFCVGTLIANRDSKLRVADNILGFKSLWMDIDIGKADSHATIKDAGAKLKEFCEAVQWPTPMVVSSGGGMHLYWPLEEMINLVQWRDIAPYMLAATRNVGLLIDTACNNKPTQVLRPAGTHHKKDPTSHKLVKVVREGEVCQFDTLKASITEYVVKHKLELTPMAVNTVDPFLQLMRKARPNIKVVREVQERDVKAVLVGCAQMRQGLKTEMPEPLWYSVLTVCAALPNGRELAHKLSEYDPRYDGSVVDNKFDGALEGMPNNCSTFKNHNPSLCEGCPNRGKVTNPIQLGNKVELVTVPEVKTPVTPTLPAPVVPTTDRVCSGVLNPPTAADAGQIVKQRPAVYGFVVNDNGIYDHEDKLVTASQIYGVGTLRHDAGMGNTTYSYLLRIITPRKEVNDVVVLGSDLLSANAANIVADLGVNVANGAKSVAQVGGFMRGIVSQLETEEPMTVHKTLGWQEDGSFVVGHDTVLADGTVAKSRLASNGLDKVNGGLHTPKGELKPWQDAAEVFNTPDQLHSQFAVCASFGSALMKHSSSAGLTFCLQGSTGLGKSTIQHVCASVWSEPVGSVFAKPSASTGSSAIAMADAVATCRSLPLMMDEMTSLSIESVHEIINMITGGVDKTRMVKSKAGVHTDSGMSSTVARQWACLAIATTNVPLRDIAMAGPNPKADCMRVFEFVNLKRAGSKSSSASAVATSRRIDAVKENYGHAGVVFARYMVANRDKLEGWIDGCTEKMIEELGYDTEERYWLRGCAATMVAAELAVSAGLIKYDLKQLWGYMIEQFENQRELVKPVTQAVGDRFSNMLAEMQPHAIIVGEVQASENPDPEAPGVPLVTMPRSGMIHMRIDTVEGVGYISSNQVTEWAKRHRVSRHELITAAVERGQLTSEKRQKIRLATHAKGVPNNPVWCLQIVLSPEDLKQFKEHAEEAAKQESKDDK